MGSAASSGNRRAQDVEGNAQPSRYTPILGPMLGGSFPASVAIYNLLKDSTDEVKLLVFGGLTLGVFVVVSGLAATTLGSTTETARYAKYAALTAVTMALCLFTGGLCTLFGSPWYKGGCAIGCALVIAFLDIVWLYMDW